MSPKPFHEPHAKRDMCPPPPLKINKESHSIRKPTQRQPLIIYTQPPRIIHTHPRDFMALVQKLTGFSPSEEEEEEEEEHGNDEARAVKPAGHEEEEKEETALVISGKNRSGSINVVGEGIEGNAGSCFVTPFILEPPPSSFISKIPVFEPSNQGFEFDMHMDSLLV